MMRFEGTSKSYLGRRGRVSIEKLLIASREAILLSLCSFVSDRTYTVGDEQHGNGELEIVSRHAQVLLKAEQTSVADVDWRFELAIVIVN